MTPREDNRSSTQEQEAAAAATSNKKILYGVRHGTSLANEWMSRDGNRWGDATFRDDPALVDASLSDKGREQAAELAANLSTVDWLSDIELIAVSPLTRCIETWKYGVHPALEKILKSGGQSQRKPVVMALPLLTERVYTASDIGRPIAELKQQYPELDWKEAEEIANGSRNGSWWYLPDEEDSKEPEWRPFGQGQWYAVAGEPSSVFEKRMSRLDEWLRRRHETRILLVTHWGVLRHWTGKGVDHCGICHIDWQTGGTECP